MTYPLTKIYHILNIVQSVLLQLNFPLSYQCTCQYAIITFLFPTQITDLDLLDSNADEARVVAANKDQ